MSGLVVVIWPFGFFVYRRFLSCSLFAGEAWDGHLGLRVVSRRAFFIFTSGHRILNTSTVATNFVGSQFIKDGRTKLWCSEILIRTSALQSFVRTRRVPSAVTYAVGRIRSVFPSQRANRGVGLNTPNSS